MGMIKLLFDYSKKGIAWKEAGLILSERNHVECSRSEHHTQPGDEIVTEEESHLYVYEGGGYAAISGCSMALVPSVHGIMDPDDARKNS